tara:strand:+ start:201 stop:572 length:372 start_codon:yes stop_codon:yes gene_type:complete
MKSNIDKVYSKLPNKKHNFRKHKVDLSVAEDIREAKDKINSQIDITLNQIDELRDANSKSLDVRENGVEIYQRAMVTREDAMKAADELGIDVYEISDFKEMDDRMDVLFDSYQSLLKMVSTNL